MCKAVKTFFGTDGTEEFLEKNFHKWQNKTKHYDINKEHTHQHLIIYLGKCIVQNIYFLAQIEPQEPDKII